MNKEIGGYIEIEYNHGEMLHKNAIHLNCGRRAYSYLIKSRGIKKAWLPKFTCSSVIESFYAGECDVKFYSINSEFIPQIDGIHKEDWVVLINYYGQISNEKIRKIASVHPKLIIDNAQAYYQMPINDLDTIYTCRKYFGVSDGAILYTSKPLDGEKLEVDESFERMFFLMGRFERNADEFYEMYAKNNSIFSSEPVKAMSKLTENILHGIDYDFVKCRRTENFKYLDERLKDINKLRLFIPQGPFMYPLYVEKGKIIRKILQSRKIYIPILWPDVFSLCKENSKEYDMAANILPIPVDQRYGLEDMKYIVTEILKLVNLD